MTDVTLYNGSLRLAASVYGPPAAPGVLCLHGLSSSRETWEETVRRLEDRYRVWTLDFRGHGHSNRAERYFIADYVADATAALNAIGRPAIVVGHSLGGVTAASLAQTPHPHVIAVFLEDPPLYLGKKSECDKGVFDTRFQFLRDNEVKLQSAGAGLAKYVEFAAQIPAVQGGVLADYISQRYLDIIGSALQRQDPRTWTPFLDLTGFAGFDPSLPMQVPATVIQADNAFGAALMAGHERRLLATNPNVEVISYEGATHLVHATRATEPRFLDDLDAFVTRHAHPKD